MGRRVLFFIRGSHFERRKNDETEKFLRVVGCRVDGAAPGRGGGGRGVDPAGREEEKDRRRPRPGRCGQPGGRHAGGRPAGGVQGNVPLFKWRPPIRCSL